MSFHDSKELFPNLIKIFGLKSVQLASVHNMSKLRFIESCLSLVDEHIKVSFKSVRACNDVTELF